MSRFEDIRLDWAGNTYVIPASKVMGAIARIEDVITLEELRRYSEKGTAPLAKIAMAYGAVLRYAGAQVDDDAVYEGMFRSAMGGNAVSGSDPAGRGGPPREVVTDAVVALLHMMVPPAAMRLAAAEGDASGNGSAAASPASAAASSKKPTRRRSAGTAG